MLPYGMGTTLWVLILHSYKKGVAQAVAMFPCVAWGTTLLLSIPRSYRKSATQPNVSAKTPISEQLTTNTGKGTIIERNS